MPQRFEEVGEPRHRVDEHSGLRLEGERDRPLCSIVEDRSQPADQPVHHLAVPRPVADDARPEGHTVGLQGSGRIDGAAKKLDAAGPAGGVGGDERRLVLDVGVEQEARAGLDGGAHAQLLKPLGRAFELVAEVSLEGI